MFLDCLGQKVSREDASNKAEHEGIHCRSLRPKVDSPEEASPEDIQHSTTK